MNHTRAAIINAFWQLLDEKPYNKITVKNIVERCQVNRNTFYYHFHDIPELLETMIKERADAIIHTHYKLGSPLDCILPLIQYSTERKNAILHIYHSLHREIFLDHLNRIALYIVKEYVDTRSTTILLSAEDKKLLVRFYKCILVGITLDWLDENMSYDLLYSSKRLYALLSNPKGTVYPANEKSNSL